MHAKTPLTVAQIQHVVATRKGDTFFDPKGIVRIGLLLSPCACLVVVGDEYVPGLRKVGSTVRLVHFTVQEYFQRKREVWFPKAALDIARICITYLTLDDLPQALS